MKNSKLEKKKGTGIIGFDGFKFQLCTVTLGAESLKGQMCSEKILSELVHYTIEGNEQCWDV